VNTRFTSVSWSFGQSVRLLGRGINPSQGRYLHRTTQIQNKHTHQTSMPEAVFEPTIATSGRAKTVHALNRSATVTGNICIQKKKILYEIRQIRFIKYARHRKPWRRWRHSCHSFAYDKTRHEKCVEVTEETCKAKKRAMPYLRRFVAGFPPRRPGFEPGSGYVGFVVDKVGLWQIFSEYFGFPCQFAFHQLLQNHRLSVEADAIGQTMVAVPSGLTSVSPHKKKTTSKICVAGIE
jgi:hypothetical protein